MGFTSSFVTIHTTKPLNSHTTVISVGPTYTTFKWVGPKRLGVRHFSTLKSRRLDWVKWGGISFVKKNEGVIKIK